MITQSGALPSLQAQEAHLRASLREGKVRIIHAHPSRPSKLSNYALESASMPRPTFRTAVAADQRFVFLPCRKSAMADQDHRRSLVALSVGKARTLARPAKCCVLRAAGPLLQTTRDLLWISQSLAQQSKRVSVVGLLQSDSVQSCRGSVSLCDEMEPMYK